MSRPLSDYVALAIAAKRSPTEIAFSRSSVDDFTGTYEELRLYASEKLEFEVPIDVLRDAVWSLAECGLVRITDDPFTDTFVKVYRSQLNDFFNKVLAERNDAITNGDLSGNVLSNASDYPNLKAYQARSVFSDFHENGQKWLDSAIEGIQKYISERGEYPNDISSSDPLTRFERLAPAADRIVSISHNQIEQLSLPLVDLIEDVTQSNGLPDELGFRERILGQLKAARELINSGCFRIYLLRETLISSLGELIQKYKGHAIGVAASKLLELIIEELFKASH